MTRNLQCVYDTIPIDAIDDADQKFSTCPEWLENPDLQESIEEIGVTSPLLLQQREGLPYRIVCGFQRYRAAQRAGIDRLKCLVTQEEDELQLFERGIVENLGTRALSELEKAQILSKLKNEFRVPDRDLTRYQSRLSIRPDRFHLRRCLAIANLPRLLQEHLPSLQLETALELTRWSPEEQQYFVDLVKFYGPSRSHQRKLFGLLSELRQLRVQEGEGSPLREILRDAGWPDEADSAPRGAAPEFRALLQELHCRRYPALTAMHNIYNENLRRLQLPEAIRVSPPDYFEGPRLKVEFSVASSSELATISHKLAGAVNTPELEKIFELL